MFSPSTMNSLIQSVAALLIFTIAYLALLLSAIVGVVLAHLSYKGARLFWSRVISGAVSANAVAVPVSTTARVQTHIATNI